MLELAVVVAILWAGARALDTGHQAVKRHVAARRKAVPDRHKRAAARQAATGWWLSEILHGFPHFRHGWAAGWHDHQDIRGNARVSAARRKAERAERGLSWQAEIAAYLHRLEIAAAKREAGPTMSDQLRAILLALQKRWGEQQPDQRPDDDRPPDRKRSEDRPPDDKPNDEAPDNKPDNKQEDPMPQGSGSDINYDQTLQTCTEAIDAAEEGVNSEAITKVIALADGLGAMLRDDPDSTGQAAEAVTEANAVKEHAAALIDVLTSLKSGVESKYGPQQEALDSAGVGQPEVGYLEH